MTVKKTNYLLTFLLLLMIQPVFAQSKRQARDSSVTIIFSETKAPSKKKKSAGEDNIIKIAPLGFISGQFPVLYERRFSDIFTVVVGGGLTHRNYIRKAFVNALAHDDNTLIKNYPWSSSSNGYDIAPEAYNFDVRKPKMGYMFRVEPRVYFGGEAPEENYIGFQFNSVRYNFSIPAYDAASGMFTGAEKNEYETFSDYMVHFGRQYLHDRISVEWSTAIGLRQIKGSKYVVNGDNYQEGFASYSKSIINFGVGFTVGYHF